MPLFNNHGESEGVEFLFLLLLYFKPLPPGILSGTLCSPVFCFFSFKIRREELIDIYVNKSVVRAVLFDIKHMNRYSMVVKWFPSQKT